MSRRKHDKDVGRFVSELKHYLETQVVDERFLQGVIKKIKDFSEADQVGFYLWHANESTFTTHAIEPRGFWTSSQASADYFRFAHLEGTIGQSVQRRAPILIADIDGFLNGGGKTLKVAVDSKSELVIPVFYEGSLLGAFFLSSSKRGRFTEQQMSILSAVLPIAGIIYRENLLIAERSKLSEFTKRRATFLFNLWDIDSKGLDGLYDRTCDLFSQMLPCKFISVWYYTPLDDVLTLKRFWSSADAGEKISLSSYKTKIERSSKFLMSKSFVRGHGKEVTSLIRVWERDGDHWTTSHEKDPVQVPLGAYQNLELLERFKFRFFVPLPLTTRGGSLLGYFCIHCDNTADFTADIFASIAKNISSKIELVQYQMKQQFRDHLMFELFPRIVEFEDSVASWGGLATFICDAVSCEAVSIFLYNRARNRLELKGTTGILNRDTGQQLADQDLSDVTYDFDEHLQRIEGATGYCFNERACFIEYSFEDSFESRIGKERKLKHPERLLSVPYKEDESRVFVPVLRKRGGKEDAIGVVRCVQKKKSHADDFNRFRQDDVETLAAMAHTISMFCAIYDVMRTKDKQKDEIIETMAHDAFLPLTAMTWHAEYIERFYRALPRSIVQRKFKDLKDEIYHLTVTLSSVAVLLGTAPYKFEQKKLFASSIFRCKSLTENLMRSKSLELDYEEADVDSIPPLYLDSDKIGSVVYNLIHNAVKYSDSGTAIRIRAWEDFDGYFLSVENHGIGVPAGEEKEIFKKYGRGSNAREKGIFGTGLGLCTSLVIMRRHGGDLTLQRRSNPTVFTMFFPKRLAGGEP